MISRNQAVFVFTIFVLTSSLGCDTNTPPPPIPTSVSPIDSIQNNIAAADFTVDAYYATTYRFAEPKYWLRIAGWIAEDAIERQFIKNKPAHLVLDLGCGYGTLLAYAVENYATPGICFDVIPYIQAEIQKRYGITYQKIDIEKDAFPEALQVDVAVMTEVVEHLNFHPKHTLYKIFTALRPGGSFFISTPDADKGWGRVFDYYQSIEEMPAPDRDAKWIDAHIWQYTESEIRQVIEDAGFIIKRIEHAPGVVGLHFNIWATKPAD